MIKYYSLVNNRKNLNYPGLEGRIMDQIAGFVAQYLFILLIIGALAYLAWRQRSRWLELAFATVFIGSIAFLLSRVLDQLISSPRPFVVSGQPPLIPGALDNGFPSDHTLLVAVVAAVVTLANWRVGLVMWALALLIGLARVYARVHHLVDIAGSLIIVAVALGLYLLSKRLVSNIISRSSTTQPDTGNQRSKFSERQ
jgi:membrane-associated phospholipid phosphatase